MIYRRGFWATLLLAVGVIAPGEGWSATLSLSPAADSTLDFGQVVENNVSPVSSVNFTWTPTANETPLAAVVGGTFDGEQSEAVIFPDDPLFDYFSFSGGGSVTPVVSGLNTLNLVFAPTSTGIFGARLQIFVYSQCDSVGGLCVEVGAILNQSIGLNLTGEGIEQTGTVVPLPAALPLFGTGLALVGFIGWRTKRRTA